MTSSSVQYFTVVVVVILFHSDCNFGKFLHFGLWKLSNEDPVPKTNWLLVAYPLDNSAIHVSNPSLDEQISLFIRKRVSICLPQFSLG